MLARRTERKSTKMTGTGRREHRAWLIAAMLFLFMLINFADKAVLGLSAVPIMRGSASITRSLVSLARASLCSFRWERLAQDFWSTACRASGCWLRWC